VLARAYPASRFTGFDFADEAIAAGRAEAQVWGSSASRTASCPDVHWTSWPGPAPRWRRVINTSLTQFGGRLRVE